jgi:hypothetical protein
MPNTYSISKNILGTLCTCIHYVHEPVRVQYVSVNDVDHRVDITIRVEAGGLAQRC